MLLTFEYCQPPVPSSSFSSTGSVNLLLHLIIVDNGAFGTNTIKGGSRHAEKSCKVLMMMMKVAKEDQEQGRSRAETGQEQS